MTGPYKFDKADIEAAYTAPMLRRACADSDYLVRIGYAIIPAGFSEGGVRPERSGSAVGIAQAMSTNFINRAVTRGLRPSARTTRRAEGVCFLEEAREPD